MLLCDRWFREDREQLSPISVGDRVSILAAGLLRIGKVRLEDMGKYLCWVNNSAGEETVQVILTVTGILFLLYFLRNKQEVGLPKILGFYGSL
jgi:Immunoglobulin I-set domain.